jgi:aldehyde:ferredoxin oxidoreductase
MANGYMGKILWVDLSTNTLKDEILDEQTCRDFIGGYGIGAKILFSRMKPGADPLGPDNIFGLITGPLTGTPAIGGTRYFAVAKSPLTGGWGDSNSGGYFGPALRFAGYDGVFFTGIAPKPVYLYIDNGKAEIRDAGHLWGKDSHETEDMLKEELGQSTRIACIGPSGEKLSLIAAIMNEKGRAAARSGLGAVMGSKKLKAVAVKGDAKVPLFDDAGSTELRKVSLSALGGPVDMFKNFGGTAALTVMLANVGDTPIKNWGGTPVVEFPNPEPLGAPEVLSRMEKKYACYHCPIACGGIMKPGTGEYKYGEGVHKPEYETLGMFGANCQNNNLESIIMLNDICNRYGVDTISAGAVISMAIECYEHGLITKKDTEGIELTWGNHRAMVAMTEKMVRREGFGDVLADGTRVAARKIGKGADEFAMHVGGQEAPGHSPIFDWRFATSYLDATPGRHTCGGEAMHPPGLLPEFDPKSFAGRGKARKIGTDFNHVMVSAGLCIFVYGCYPHVDLVIKFLNLATGWNYTMDDLLKAGERISNIRQAFNMREGIDLTTVKVPGRMLGVPPHNGGPTAGVTIDQAVMLSDYLKEADWDLKTGKPSKAKLLELGLKEAAEQLYP